MSTRRPRKRSTAPRVSKRLLDGVEDRLRLGHAARPIFAASHLALVGSDETHAVAAQRRHVAPRRRDAATCAHSWRARRARACRWRAARSLARSSASPWAILAMRSAVAGATTMRSASRDSWIWPISASSLRSKRSVKTLLLGERREGERRDELRAALGQNGAHGGAPLLQAAHEIEALIGGDAAADDEQNALALH